MTGKLSSELKNWFYTLGFDDKNLTADEIEEEFNRLSPPEMRDIWRNIMNHVLPVDKSRYIKKILLLNELKKQNKNCSEKQLIKKNINSLVKWQALKNQEKVAAQVNNCLRAVEETEAKTNRQNELINNMDNEWKNLIAENSEKSNQQALIELKLQNHEKNSEELVEMHSYLTHINSSWNSKSAVDKHSSTDILKDILKKINDFGRRRRNMKSDMKIDVEQQLLMDAVTKLTFNTPVSEMHKTVIYMLRDTLSALIKLSDYVGSKHDSDRSSYFNSKLVQLKKQSVELFIENANTKKKVEKLREDFQNCRIQLLAMISDKCDEQTRKNFEMWLDSESLKHCMTTRLNYLIRKEESMRKTLPMSIVPDFTNGSEQEKLFKVIVDYKKQLESMELEMSNNLMYLSDESINTFVECQHHCKSRIVKFIGTNHSEKHKHIIVDLTDSLKKEITLLQRIKMASVTDQSSITKPYLSERIIPDYVISEFIKKCSFYVYLTNAYNDIRRKIDNESLNTEFLDKKRIEIQNVEEKFANDVRKLVCEAKTNLKNIQEHSTSCQKNYELWTKSSVNEIIPPQILLADRNFTEWHKRYVAIIQCLRRQQIELSKLD